MENISLLRCLLQTGARCFLKPVLQYSPKSGQNWNWNNMLEIFLCLDLCKNLVLEVLLKSSHRPNLDHK